MLELRLLSRPRVRLDGEVVDGFVSDKAKALLIYLALNEGPRPRQALAGLLWEEKGGKRARANLRVTLHSVKKRVPGYLHVARKQVAFAHDRSHWIDVITLAQAAEEDALEALAEAAALYEDDFLSGLRAKGAPELEAWLLAEREKWRLRLIGLLERLAEGYITAGQWVEATATARRLLAIEPWREQTHRRLILLLARQGEYGAALAQYEQCREVLAAELGVEPMPETVNVYERIRQLGRQPRHNLPSAPTPLIDRAREREAVVARLLVPACRIVTLYGPGGIGKTRPALAVA